MREKVIKKLIKVRDILDKKINGKQLTDGEITFTLKNEKLFTVDAIKSNPYARTFVEYAQRLENNARKRQMENSKKNDESKVEKYNIVMTEETKQQIKSTADKYINKEKTYNKLPNIVIK